MRTQLERFVVNRGWVVVLGVLALSACSSISPTPPLKNTPGQAVGQDNAAAQPVGFTLAWQSSNASSSDYTSVLAWSPDGTRLVFGGYLSAQVFNSRNGRSLQNLTDCPAYAPSGSGVTYWNSDGSLFACGSSIYSGDLTRKVRVLQNLDPSQVTDGPPFFFGHLRWRPGSNLLALNFFGDNFITQKVGVWDAATGLQVSTLLQRNPAGDLCAFDSSYAGCMQPGPSDQSVAPRWTPDGAAVLMDGQLHDPQTGQPLVGAASDGSRYAGNLSPDGAVRLVGTDVPGSLNSTLRFVNAATGQDLYTLPPDTLDYRNAIWSPDSRTLLVANFKTGQVLQVNPLAQTVSRTLPVPVEDCRSGKTNLGPALGGPALWTVSPDSKRLAVQYTLVHPQNYLCTNSLYRVWDLSTNTVLSVPGQTSLSHTAHVYSLAALPGGGVASGSRDGQVKLWTSSGETLLTTPGGSEVLYSVAFNPAGTRLATAGTDGTIRVWNYQAVSETASASLTLYQTLSGHTYTVRSLAYSPDGSRLASGSWDSSVRLWNPDTGEQTALLSGHTGYVNAVAYNPAGTVLASASNDGTVKLWNPSSATLTRTLGGHSDAVLSVAWSPDGTRLASGGATGDRSVKLWNAQTGTLERTLSGSYGAVRAVAWSPNGQTVYAVGDDTRLHAWNAATGEQVLEQSLSTVPLFSLALSPDGKTFYTGDAQGQVSAWSVQ